MAFKDAKDIFDENEKKEHEKMMQGMGAIFNTVVRKGLINLHPSTEKKIQEYLEWDNANKKREYDMKKKLEKFGYIFAILIFVVITLGSIFLIKIFWKGIFG